MYTIEQKMQDIKFIAALPKSRKEAVQLGASRYYTGDLCPRGRPRKFTI